MAGRDVPAIVGAVVLGCMSTLDAHDPAAAARVRGQLRPDLQAALADASRVGWLPLELHIAMHRALLGFRGEKKALSLVRRAYYDMASMPLLAPIVRGAGRLAGGDPERLMRFGPHLYLAMYRHCGSVAVHTEGGTTELLFADLPAAVLDDEGYQRGIAAGILGLLEAAGSRLEIGIARGGAGQAHGARGAGTQLRMLVQRPTD